MAEYLTLSGMRHKVVEDLKRDKVKTMHITSPHNFFSIMNLNVGDMVFLTDESPEDIETRTQGVVAKVRSRQISMQRFYHASEGSSEEREILSARLQLEKKFVAVVKAVNRGDLGTALIVRAERVLSYHAL
ncbi:MAG: DUF473 family protein [Candidatus Syntropharchaeales archaeon]|nr:DUF473 domain-containing protein [Candidatus Syntrophoarchaeum sp.]